jgi:hypothetical protein
MTRREAATMGATAARRDFVATGAAAARPERVESLRMQAFFSGAAGAALR